jgi:hypothetical protein
VTSVIDFAAAAEPDAELPLDVEALAAAELFDDFDPPHAAAVSIRATTAPTGTTRRIAECFTTVLLSVKGLLPRDHELLDEFYEVEERDPDYG